MSLDNLPVEWLSLSIDEISDDVTYGYTASSTSKNTGCKLLRITDIQDDSVNWADVPFCEISENDFKKYTLENGDLVFARTGATVGKSYLIRNLKELSVYASYLIRIRFNSILNPRYFSYFFKSADYWNQISSSSAGIGQPNVNGTKLKQLNVPIAPLAEQQEIVRQLDVMLAQVEQIKARLDAIPAILKKCRQSVLADAVSGKLTEEWREKNIIQHVDISKIHQEHETYFKNKGVKKYQKPNDVSIDNQPYELPNSWSWFRSEQLCDLITKGTTPSKEKMSKNGEIPYVKVYNLTFDGSLDFTIEPTFISKQTHDGELARSKVFVGDVLMNIVGPPLGKVSIVPNQYKEWNINQAISIFRPVTGVINKYLAMCLMDARLLDITIRKSKATAGQSNLTLEICRDFPLPIAPIEEQVEIIDLVNKLLGYASNINKMVESTQKRVNLLTQSILAKAFSGELTSEWREQHQDLITGINSAESLLAAIQAEREASKPAKKTRKKKEV